MIRREEKAKNKRKEGYEKDMSIGEAFGFSKLGILSEGPPLFLFDMLLTTRKGSGTRCSLLGDSFVFLDVGPSILFLVFPLFRCFGLYLIGRVSSFGTQPIDGQNLMSQI